MRYGVQPALSALPDFPHLLAFLLFSFLGTVPLNIQVNDWDAEAPPSD